MVAASAVHDGSVRCPALFFPPGDERALAELMHRIVTEPGLREELIRRGSVRHRAMAAWDQSAVTLEAIAESARRAGL